MSWTPWTRRRDDGRAAAPRDARARARTADPANEEAAPAPAPDTAAAVPTAAAALGRAARAAAAPVPEGVLGPTETPAGDQAARTVGGAAQKGEARGERHRLHGGEAEAAGLPAAAGVRMQDGQDGQFLLVSLVIS